MSWKCKQCGKCCKFVGIYQPNLTQDEIRYYALHHIYYVDSFLIIQQRCSKLKFHNSKYYCSIYEKRPDVCRKFGEKMCELGRKIYEKIKA